MPNSCPPILALAAALSLFASHALNAQPGTVVPGPLPPVSDPAGGSGNGITPRIQVDEVKPDTYLLRRKDGELVKVLNMPYETFMRLYNQDMATIEPQLPPYSLEQLNVQGRTDDSVAELTVTFILRLQGRDWTRVPLRFEKAILRAPPTFDGDGELFVRYDSGGDGYVCWVRAGSPPAAPEPSPIPPPTETAPAETEPAEAVPAETPPAETAPAAGAVPIPEATSPPTDAPVVNGDVTREFTAKFLIPLRKFGAETRLELQMPRAATSQMDLMIPTENISATASDGVLNVFHEDGETRVSVIGTAGDVRVTWREGDVQPKDKRPVLELNTATLVRVEGQRQVSSDVDLEVRSLRGEFDAFTIRLPAETRLFPRQFLDSGMQITELPVEDGQAGKRVEVKLDRPTAGPVTVQLLAELTPRTGSGEPSADDGAPPEYEVGGIEVEDAIRQSGTIDFAVQGDWSLNWLPGANVHRTAVPEALRDSIVARFTHSRRAFSLRIQVARRETQITVEPQYVLYFESNRVRLEATLNYRLRGRELYGVEVDLPGWTVNEVLPDALINREAFDPAKNAPLSIPLRAQALPESGQFSLKIAAVRDITDPDGKVTFNLPRPWAKAVSPAAIAFIPAENVELSLGDSQGLQRESLPPKMDLPVQQREPLYYRDSSEEGTAAVAAKVTTRGRSVSVSMVSTVKLDEFRYRVEQDLLYDISYERLKTLLFNVDRTVLDSGTLKVLHDGKALLPTVPEQGGDSAEPPAAVPAAPQAEIRRETVQIRVDLANEQIGDCELKIQYDGRMPVVSAGIDVSLTVPLILPVVGEDTTVTGQRLELSDTGAVKSRVSDTDWEPASASDNPLRPAGSYQSDALKRSVALMLSRSAARGGSPTMVTQVWIQSWLGEKARRERVAYRIQTDQPYIEFELPDQAELAQVAANGQAATVTAPDPENPARKRIELPTLGGAGCVIEFWYALPGPLGLLNQVALRVPEIMGEDRVQRLYWQVAMPPDEHLLFAPRNMTEELLWRPRGVFWGRETTLSQADLEHWVGATEQDGLPDSVNQYLFSSFGGIPQSICTTAGRSPIVLTLSGLVLLLGLGLIYLPWLRHPAGLFVVGLGLVTLILLRPELSVPSIQASALGLALAGAAVVLKRISDSRELQRVVIRGTRQASPDSNTERALQLQGEGNSKVSTATAMGAELPSVGEPKV